MADEEQKKEETIEITPNVIIKYTGDEAPDPAKIKMSGVVQIGKKIMIITGPNIVKMEKVKSLEEI